MDSQLGSVADHGQDLGGWIERVASEQYLFPGLDSPARARASYSAVSRAMREFSGPRTSGCGTNR